MRVYDFHAASPRLQATALLHEAGVHLDAIYSYLYPGEEDRTDFSDIHEHTMAASRVGRLLEILIDTSKCSLIAGAMDDAIARHGEQADMQHVIDALLQRLSQRAAALATVLGNPDAKEGPIAIAYLTLLTTSLGSTIAACRNMAKADITFSPVMSAVGTKMGLNDHDIREALHLGNRDVMMVLATELWEEIANEYRAKGLPIPANAKANAFAMAGLAEEPQEPVDDATVDVFAGLGINPSDIIELQPGVYGAHVERADLPGIMAAASQRLPASEDQSRIKVG